MAPPRVVKAVPPNLLIPVKESHLPGNDINHHLIGANFMYRMGWKGAGLGKHENGTHHPPPLLAPRAPYRGLGATARTAHTKGPINFVAGSHPPAPDKQAPRDPPPPDLKRDRPRIVAWKEGDNDSMNMYGLFKPIKQVPSHAANSTTTASRISGARLSQSPKLTTCTRHASGAQAPRASQKRYTPTRKHTPSTRH